MNRHLTEEGIKTLTNSVNNDLDPRKIIDEALNVSIKEIYRNTLKPITIAERLTRHWGWSTAE